MTLKDERHPPPTLCRSVDIQYATVEKQRNSSRRNEEAEPKWKQHPVVDVSGDESEVVQSCPTICGTMDCSMPGFPLHHQFPQLAQTHLHQVNDAIQPSHPLLSHLLLPSLFPSSRFFSNEFALCIRWPKYWSFTFSISPSNEYSRLIS